MGLGIFAFYLVQFTGLCAFISIYFNYSKSLFSQAHKEVFNQLITEARINGLAGHRSVGGYRASMYNALGEDSVQVLVDCMKELEKK